MGVAVIVALLATASVGRPAGRVFGGRQIQIQSAPWVVFYAVTGANAEGGWCGGSIIDALHVVTAAHCVVDTAGAPLPPTAFKVRAGISNFNSPQPSDAEQDRGVVSVRVHPAFSLKPPGGDDVAVFQLDAPLDLSGSAVRAVSLPARGAPFPAGASAVIAGWGAETATAGGDGSLNELNVPVAPRYGCTWK